MEQAFDKDALETEYETRRRHFEWLEGEVNFILSKELQAAGIKLHSQTSRVKTAGSFIEKVARKDSRDPFDDIEDLVGIRVVALFLSDLPAIYDIIRNRFEVLSEENRIEGGSDETSFGYMSVHFIVQMKPSYVGPRYDEIKGLKAEIQVRTILMDAWANVSHYLDYKGESSIPSELRRDFYALSGLFFIADKHFELFFREKLESRRRAEEIIRTDKPDLHQELNLETFQAYLQGRLPDRKQGAPETLSTVVEELSLAGYTSLDQVDKDLEAAWEAFEKYEKEKPPSNSPKYASTGVVRAALSIANPKYASRRPDPKRYEEYRDMVKKPSEKGRKRRTGS